MSDTFSPGDTIRFAKSPACSDLSYYIDFMDMFGVIVSYTYPDNERYQYPMRYEAFYGLAPELVPVPKPLLTSEEATNLEQNG